MLSHAGNHYKHIYWASETYQGKNLTSQGDGSKKLSPPFESHSSVESKEGRTDRQNSSVYLCGDTLQIQLDKMFVHPYLLEKTTDLRSIDVDGSWTSWKVQLVRQKTWFDTSRCTTKAKLTHYKHFIMCKITLVTVWEIIPLNNLN